MESDLKTVWVGKTTVRVMVRSAVLWGVKRDDQGEE